MTKLRAWCESDDLLEVEFWGVAIEFTVPGDDTIQLMLEEDEAAVEIEFHFGNEGIWSAAVAPVQDRSPIRVVVTRADNGYSAQVDIVALRPTAKLTIYDSGGRVLGRAHVEDYKARFELEDDE